MNKKNWLILGVVLSVVWAIGAGLNQHREDVARATNFAEFSYNTCIGSPQHSGPAGVAACDKERKDIVATFMANDGTNVLLAALVPIPFGWLAGYILLMLTRIQVAGFRAVFPWGSLTRSRKFAVFGCGIAIALVCLFVAGALLNLFADARVPVALATAVSVNDIDGETVYAQGTWTRHGNSSGSGMAYPLQVSQITCYRSESRCIEARAMVADAGQGGTNTLLTPEVVEYDVTSWANGVVMYGLDYPCASESFSVDTNTKSVSGFGHATNGEKAFCKKSKFSAGEWTYRMEDGFTVYWEYRQKNRPALLKIIQSFFGN